MYALEFIYHLLANFFREAWRMPQTIARNAKERLWQTRRDMTEAERLDRIRQPWKYAGK